ncbi:MULTISPECIES: M23 family metallopeptidase [Clostridium]|jgi:hypothetical protein|uniref:M23 family metallopeptidase n=1 Tax=Clostridium TaxID=1485 RepID=UPI000E865629|nr:M23 family metallopeptidase [Clostridium tyrobutyricum]HBF76984.1 hypothetical protein [Clostridiaceae bacterium]
MNNDMNNNVDNNERNSVEKKHKKKTRRISKRISRKILRFLLPIILIFLLICLAVDFFFYYIPKAVNTAENKALKTYAIKQTDKANISDLHLEDGTKLYEMCDFNGKDTELALKWSDLYAMVIFEDNTSIESFNADKENKKVRKRFDKIAYDLAPSFTYIKGNIKVTLTKEVPVTDKEGNVVGIKQETTVISNDTVYYLKTANTIYGTYNYSYEAKTDERTDSEGTWTTTSLQLVNSTVTDENKRLDEYLKKMLKLTEQREVEDTRNEFIQESIGIYTDQENSEWLLDENNNASWGMIGGVDANISADVINAIMKASEKYSIPPWLIMGYCYHESRFIADIMACDDLGKTVKVSAVKNNPEYMNNPRRSLGLMQVTMWSSKCRALGYDPVKEALNPYVQIDVACNELVNIKFKQFNIDPKKVDWKGNGWVEQTWKGCQAYNGLVYYNQSVAKAKEYAFTHYLRTPKGDGIFDIAEKYKLNFQLNKNGGYTKISVWPTPNYYNITSPFGMRIHPTLHVRKLHPGIDIGAPSGAKVISATNGVVIRASNVGDGYGNCVIVRNSAYDCLYGHLSSISVRVGEKIPTGKQIGNVGSTGFSTGPHLHFGISKGDYKNNNWINPLTIVSH